MSEITVRLKIPDEILKQVDLDKVVERLEREIMLEYNLEKAPREVQGQEPRKVA